MDDKIIEAIATVIALILLYVAVWALFCGAAAIIMWAFGMEFSWKIATGAFFACVILRWVLSAAKSDNDK